jgi:hypothetical protein
MFCLIFEKPTTKHDSNQLGGSPFAPVFAPLSYLIINFGNDQANFNLAAVIVLILFCLDDTRYKSLNTFIIIVNDVRVTLGHVLCYKTRRPA